MEQRGLSDTDAHPDLSPLREAGSSLRVDGQEEMLKRR